MDVSTAAHYTLISWEEQQVLPPPQESEDGKGLSHARFLLDTVMREAAEWKKDKLNRWLGYAQAILVEKDVLSLREVKECNRLA